MQAPDGGADQSTLQNYPTVLPPPPTSGDPVLSQQPTYGPPSTPQPRPTIGPTQGPPSGVKATAASKPHKTAAPPPPPGMSGDVYNAIARAAKENGVPLSLALAIAYHESGFNAQAVGDNGTSFGLYQLHEGGELGNHDSSWANDPYNNASTALRVVGAVLKQHPNLTPGQVAALAQRPADQAAYANNVDGILKQASGDASFFSTKLANAPQGVGSDGGYGGFGSGLYGAYNVNAAGSAATGASFDPKQLAAAINDLGFSTALINSDASLKRVFQDVVQNHLNADAFRTEVRNTTWWQKRTDAQRTFDEQHYSDPTQQARAIAIARADIQAQAAKMGVAVDPTRLGTLTQTAVRNGLTPEEIRSALAAEANYKPNVAYGGDFGQVLNQIQKSASDYYVDLSPQTVNQLAHQALGKLSPDGTPDTTMVDNYLKQQALSKFPWLADQINQGFTVAQLADPYKQAMAQTLEVDPTGIKNNDPTVLKGLQYMDPTSQKGGYTTMPLWKYQETLKSDPRWMQTDNARNSLMDTATGVLKDMGLTS